MEEIRKCWWLQDSQNDIELQVSMDVAFLSTG